VKADDILKAIDKKYGVGVATKGVHLEEISRLPTGIFPFDLATGGGFPRGRISVVYGPESCLKTTILLLAIKQQQKLFPELKSVLIDVEAAYDPEWGEKLGVDNDKLIYVIPDYAEQVVDIAEEFLYAEDVALVGIDSIAALITTHEIESSAEKANVGGSGLVVGKLYRKATLAMGKARKEGRKPILLAINQIRYKIGVLYGDPEVMPGGVAFKFAASLVVRLYGKDEFDKKISQALPAWKKTTGIIKKWKVPVVTRAFEFHMAMLPESHPEFGIGGVDDWNTVSAWLKQLGELEQMEKGGWTLFNEKFPTLKACKEEFYGNDDLQTTAKEYIISAAKEANVAPSDAKSD